MTSIYVLLTDIRVIDHLHDAHLSVQLSTSTTILFEIEKRGQEALYGRLRPPRPGDVHWQFTDEFDACTVHM